MGPYVQGLSSYMVKSFDDVKVIISSQMRQSSLLVIIANTHPMATV